MPSSCLHAREVGRVQEAFRRALGAHQRTIRALLVAIGTREIGAGVEPLHRSGLIAMADPLAQTQEAILSR